MFSPRMRAEFSTEDDILLTKFIATYNPAKHGRSGNALYQRLVDNASFLLVLYCATSLISLQVDGKWNWSKKHSWQSWRNRYAKNSDEFDRKILKYQKKKGINAEEKTPKEKSVLPPPDGQEETASVPSKEMKQGTKRAGGKVSPQQRKAKRAKLETNQPDGESSRLPLIEVEATSQIPAAGSSHIARSPLTVQEQSEHVSDVPLLAPKPASTVNVPLLPAHSDTLPLPSSQPDSTARSHPPTTSQLRPSSEPLAASSQQVATPKLPHSGRKRVLKPKLVSPPFRSFSPSPNRTSSNKKKTLAKVVEGHFTTSLTDRLGRVPLRDRPESENGETRAWPPVRAMKGKVKDAGPTAVSSSAVQERERHPINRVETPTSRPAPVPSIDPMLAPSTASTSRIPPSSTSASLRLPHRYSLPSRSTHSALPADLSGYLTSLNQSGPAMLPVPPARVPNIDPMRAPSAASTSRIPRSGTSASAHRLSHRNSLPSKSTPSTLPADLSGYLTSLDQPGPAMLPVPPALITPADVPLFISVGFNTLVSRIAAAHGYAPSVVLELYKHLGSLKEVDDFMRAMRNNSEEWAGVELERRKREARRAGGKTSKRRNDSESSGGESSVEGSENGGDAPSGSRRGRLQPAPLEHRTPNGLHVRYVPPPDESDYEPPPTSRAALWKRTSMGGGGSLSGSRGTSATGRYKSKENEAAEYKMEEDEDTVDSSEGGDDIFGSGEDEESEADVERAEEESVADELVPESESNPEQDAENENKLASDHGADSQQVNQEGHQHHEFSQARAPYHHHPHVKRESLTPPRLHGDSLRISTHNGTGVLDDMSDGRTRSVSRSRDADEDRPLFSTRWDTLNMLEKQRETVSLKRKIVQLLR